MTTDGALFSNSPTALFSNSPTQGKRSPIHQRSTFYVGPLEAPDREGA